MLVAISRRTPWQGERTGVVLIALLALVMRWAIAWQPMDRLLAISVADDMFYYLQLAANWVAGKGVSFDGTTITNGFHPLHFLICAGVLKLGFLRETAVHLILTLTSLWGVATACLLGLVVRKLTNRGFWGFLAFALFALNPFVILQDLNGLETSVYGMFLSAAFLVYLHLRETLAHSFWKWAGLGLLVGLTLMARTEAVFLPLILAVDILWHLGRKQMPWTIFFRALVTAGVVLLVISPWVVWNLVHFGTVEQDSGKIFPLIAQLTSAETLGRSQTWWDYANEGVRNTAWNIYILGNMLLGVPYTAAKKYLVFLVVVPALAVGFLLGRYRWSYAACRPALKRFGFGILYMCCLFCYYTYYHRSVHWRYFHAMFIVSLPVLVVLLSGFNLDEVLQTPKRFYTVGAMAVFLVASYALMTVKGQEFPAQKNMYTAALWMRHNLPAEAQVGAFNAGIYGFWSGHRVFNLDGVTNGEIYSVMRQKDMWGYLERKNIQYLCDFDGTLTHYLHLFGQDQARRPLLRLQVFGNSAELGDPLAVYQILAVPAGASAAGAGKKDP